MNHGSFGRRAGSRRQSPRAKEVIAPATQRANAEVPEIVIEQLPPVDHELHEWKQARKRAFQIPWRPLSLMASLCFGIASFVLPASVNNTVQWPLYALAGMSLYVGFHKRRAKSQ